MKNFSNSAQRRIVFVSAFLSIAILLSILYQALLAAQDGEVERARQILTGTALAVIGLGVSVAALSIPILLMYQPVKKVYRRLRADLPDSVVFMVTAPAHHSLDSADNLNAPEIDLPFTIAAVFSANSEGLAWWASSSKKEPIGFLPVSRFGSISVDDSGNGSLKRLVVELSSPAGVLKLNVIDDRSIGFRLRQPGDMEALARKIERAFETR